MGRNTRSAPRGATLALLAALAPQHGAGQSCAAGGGAECRRMPEERCPDRDPGTGDGYRENDTVAGERCPCPDQAYVWALANGSVAVADSVARLWAGPLTVAHVLQAAWPEVLAAARERGVVRLHVVGAHADLEPRMRWEAVLLGEAPAVNDGDQSDSGGSITSGSGATSSKVRHQMLQTVVDAAGAAPPFQGLELDVLLNGYPPEFEVECLQALGRRRSGVPRSRLRCAAGSYVEVASREPAPPDFALLLNAGLSVEPGRWKDSLVHLLRSRVPTIVTNYNSGWSRTASSRALAAARFKLLQRGVPLAWVGERVALHSVKRSCRRRRLGDLKTLELLGGRILDGYPNPFFYADSANSNGFANAEVVLLHGLVDGIESEWWNVSEVEFFRKHLFQLVEDDHTASLEDGESERVFLHTFDTAIGTCYRHLQAHLASALTFDGPPGVEGFTHEYFHSIRDRFPCAP